MARAHVQLISGATLLLMAFALNACRDVPGTVRRDAGSGDAAETEDAGDAGVCAAAPMNHRSTAMACSMTRPSTADGGSGGRGQPGECVTDADCADGGLNGRCVVSSALNRLICSYDECFTDTDCADAGGICACRDPATFGANTCLPAGCHVDADCGACGYCSPVTGGCFPHIGVVSYECHTPQDQCTNDSDCDQVVSDLYCVFDPTKESHWVCAPADCSG
jgi:hypothetical protein